MKMTVMIAVVTGLAAGCASVTPTRVTMHGGDPSSVIATSEAVNSARPTESLESGADEVVATMTDTVDPDAVAPEVAFAFVCPMHPHEGAHEPGRCPVCGMELRPVRGAP